MNGSQIMQSASAGDRSLCAGAALSERNIRYWPIPKISIFRNEYALQKRRSLKPIVPKYRPDPLSRLEDIHEEVYSTELKPIVGITSGLLLVGTSLSF